MRRTEARVEGSERASVRRGDEQLDVWTLNVSRGGVRLLAEVVLQRDEELSIRLGDDAPWRRGRVVWVKAEPDGCVAGLAFSDLDDHGAAPAAEPPAEPT